MISKRLCRKSAGNESHCLSGTVTGSAEQRLVLMTNSERSGRSPLKRFASHRSFLGYKVTNMIEGCPIGRKNWRLDCAALVCSLGVGEAELRLGVHKYKWSVGCPSSPRPLFLIPVAMCNAGFLPKPLAVPLLHLPHIVIRQHGPFILGRVNFCTC